MSHKKIKFVHPDMNVFYGFGFIPLRYPLLIKEIEEEYGAIRVGQKIWLSMYSVRNEKLDPTVFPGIIQYSSEPKYDSKYKIVINERDFEYLSESKEFVGYTIPDVLGVKIYQDIKSAHPELLIDE